MKVPNLGGDTESAISRTSRITQKSWRNLVGFEVHHCKLTLMKHAGEEYRRELIRAQQRKVKGLAQNIAVKRQIDTVHKERESIQAENILLKS